MYCDYYGFREKPFQITPNPRFLYLSRNHREAFAHLLYGINAHGGFIELTGEVGTGKTTVLRTLLEQLDDSTHRTALILNPCLSAPELLANINREFAIPHEDLDSGALLEELSRFLLHENREGKTVVLVIDEAQNLAPQVLEQIRLISNLETETDKLIQIVLAGQPELKTLLERAELRQLSQRITVRYHLLPMDFEDSQSYIRHRLQVAGGEGKVEFSPAAAKRIYAFAKGAPRLINLACDRALLVGYTDETRRVDGRIASTALAELRQEVGGGLPRRKWLLTAAVAACVAILSLAAAQMGGKLRHGAGSDGANSPRAEAGRPLKWESLPKGPYPAANAILGLWGEDSVTPGSEKASAANLARERGFSVTPLTTLGDLSLLDTPAIVEIMPGKGERSRSVAIVSLDGQSLRISPQLEGAETITLAELARVWTGRGEIFWRNREQIPAGLLPRQKSPAVARLQRILQVAGLLQNPGSGTFDEATVAAVRSLQHASGLAEDGIPGDRTLLVLYRDHWAGEKSPRLAPGGGRSK